MATQVPALIQLSDPRVAAQLVIYYSFVKPYLFIYLLENEIVLPKLMNTCLSFSDVIGNYFLFNLSSSENELSGLLFDIQSTLLFNQSQVAEPNYSACLILRRNIYTINIFS